MNAQARVSEANLADGWGPDGSAGAAGRARALPGDEAGAIALFALFMAVFLTALVYYVAGIGETVLQRERMQDAADAAAFSAAALHARGMNAIVLVNMVMAALLAVLVALKLVELIITMAILAIALASFFAPGLASAIPALAQARQNVQTVHDELRPGINSALDALHTTARGIRVLVPIASQAHVVESVRQHYAPPARIAFALPPRPTLPTRDGSFATLCDRAGEYTGALTKFVLEPVLKEAVAGLIDDAVTDLTQSRADWFCGTDGHPPRTKHEREDAYPLLDARERCQQVDSQAADYAQNAADEHTRVCEQAEQDEQDSEPEELTAECRTRCEQGGPYEQRAARARLACAPEQDGAGRLYDFLWQERHYRRTYERTAGGWVRVSSDDQEKRSARYARHRADARPCGHPRADVGPDWQAQSVDPVTGAALPLCSDAAPPRARGQFGQRVALDHTDVTRIFGCKRKVVQRFELEADQLDAQQAETKVPQELLPEVILGEAPLQIRAAVLGELPPFGAEGVQRIAAWGRERQTVLASLLPDTRELGRVAVAQAEYFYALEDRETPPADFMWGMRWQARLRRVQLPERREAPDERDRTQAEQFGAVPLPSFGSWVEACDAAIATADDATRRALGAAQDEEQEKDEEEGPCAALERVTQTEALH